jgi:hypothetical protein
MGHLTTLREISWTALSALAAGAVLVLLAFYSVSLALLVLLALLIVGVPYLLITAATRGWQRVAQAPHTPHTSAQPMPELTVLSSSGEALQGRLVPVEQADGCQMVLTAQGYVLVNDEGRVIHRLHH